MALQHSPVEKSLLWHILLNAKVGTFIMSYPVIRLFISCFTTFIAKIPTSFLNQQFFLNTSNSVAVTLIHFQPQVMLDKLSTH